MIHVTPTFFPKMLRFLNTHRNQCASSDSSPHTDKIDSLMGQFVCVVTHYSVNGLGDSHWFLCVPVDAFIGIMFVWKIFLALFYLLVEIIAEFVQTGCRDSENPNRVAMQ